MENVNYGYFQRQMPPVLADLVDLAFDLRWNNCPAARQMWSRFDPEMWSQTENPILILEAAHQAQIDAAASDPELLRELESWRREINEYYSATPEYGSIDPDGTVKQVAYFSMEFGLSESLPIYSGGLGMLAGDHLKTASDIGVPLIGIGLLYQQGYFRQVIGEEGEQLETYPFNDPGSLPIRPLGDERGNWIRIRLPLPNRTLHLRVWEARVGRVRLLLLDSNDAMNTAWDRGITAQLYDSSRVRRLLQELVLGVGGWRLIERLGLDIDVCHLNEGHAAFAVLARAVGYARANTVPLPVAWTTTRAGNVFTTHTPVGAAFDRFDPKMIALYAQPFLAEAGFPLDTLMSLGRCNAADESEPFNMAWLAVRGCGHINAVSRLHGNVSRDLLSPLFPRWPKQQIPVRAITNGVHVPTWASHRAAVLWGEGRGGHLWLNGLNHVAQRIKDTPAAEFWSFRTQQRQTLLKYVESRARKELGRSGNDRIFDPNVLTIGFARRFATYKRANLLLTDPERFKRLLLDQKRPVQLLVSGKAHPNDGFGKQLIQQMTQFLNQADVRERAVFLEDYDMVLAQHLIAGVDVWLNTPLRPNEACGTSGMKVLANGGLNVSILDGWWDEVENACDEIHCPGWTIGSRESGSPFELNLRDTASLFDILENHVIPEFYERDVDGIPHRWIERVKASMADLTPQFSATRMLHEYIDHGYLPAARAYAARSAANSVLAQEIRNWSDRIRTHWQHVRIGQLRSTLEDGRRLVSVECWLDNVSSHEVQVQLYTDLNGTDAITIVELEIARDLPGAINGYLYCGELPNGRSVEEFAVRIVPYHPAAIIPLENNCITWDR